MKLTLKLREWHHTISHYSPTREDVVEGICLAVSNIYATEPREEERAGVIIVLPFMGYDTSALFLPLLPKGSSNITVRGEVGEAHGYVFNLYIFNCENYELWRMGRPYEALYEGKGKNQYSFQFIIKHENIKEIFPLVVEGVMPGVQLDVNALTHISWLQPTSISVEYNVSISWSERPYAHMLGGIVLGGGLTSLGFILMIV